MPSSRSRLARRVGFAAVVLVASLGCSSFDTTRTPADTLTLGQEIVYTFCMRMASDAFPNDVSGLRWHGVCRATDTPPMDTPPRVTALLHNRDRLARALDSVMPPMTHDDLGNFLGDMLPFYDPPRERLPTNTRLIASLLESVEADSDALGALARIGSRVGYRPLRLALGTIRPILSYPDFDHFAGVALHALVDLPPTLPGGTDDGAVAPQLTNVEAALGMYLAAMQPAAPLAAGELSNLQLARNLLFTADPLFGSGTAHYVVARDDRGIVAPYSGTTPPTFVFTPPVGGTVPAPFVDNNGDGLADVDSLGRFVDGSGMLLHLPTPLPSRNEGAIARSPGGLAIDATSTLPIYSYFDADQTLLAGVIREGLPWFRGTHPVILDLTHGLPTLLGPPVAHASHHYGMATLDYPGFDTTTSPAVDIVYALAAMMAQQHTEPLLHSVEDLLRDHEGDAAGVVASAHYLLDQSDMYPNAQMAQPNVFWDDMIALAVRWAHVSGMLEAVIRSFADARSAQLGDIYGGLMRYRDRVDYDPSNINGPPIGPGGRAPWPFMDHVDRSMPDTDGNESLFERSIALIDGLNGVQVCNREGAVLHIRLGGINLTWPLIGSYHRCELMNIPNVAAAYAESILGTFQLPINDAILNAIMNFLGVFTNPDDILEQSSGIQGLTRHPTPQALNRLVFWGTQLNSSGQPNSLFVHDLLDPVVDRHGQDVVQTYHGTIFAWEQPGFYDGMTPLLTVLHDPRFINEGSTSGEYAFGALLGTIYGHWPTRQHWHTSNVPGSLTFNHQDDGRSYEELLADGFIDGRLVRNLYTASSTLETLSFGSEDGLGVLASAAEELIDPDRNPGMTTRSGATSYMTNDGAHTVGVSPVELMLEGLRNADAAFAAAPADRGDAFHRGRNALTLQLLNTDTAGTSYTFHDQRGRAIVLALLPFLRDRINDHTSRGDLTQWSHDLPNDTANTIAGPVVGGLVNLLDVIQNDPAARDALVALVAYLVDEASDFDAFLATLYAGSDLLQVFGDDADIVPIGHALSAALAPNARSLVAGMTTGQPNVPQGVAADALGLIRELQGIDTRHVLHRLLANLVALPADGSEETPLEVILDVMSQINRSQPGLTTDYDAADYHHALGEGSGFMRDPRRGVERLYSVIQDRCVTPQGNACSTMGATQDASSEVCGTGTCTCMTAIDGTLRWSCALHP
jgi:hypothetical protein